jgi:hypothetical protein
MRKRIVESVLATDMTFHAKQFSFLKLKIESLSISQGKNLENIFDGLDNIALYALQQEFMNIITDGKPGIWWMQWYNVWYWASFLYYLGYADTITFKEQMYYRISTRKHFHYRSIIEHHIEQHYKGPVHVFYSPWGVRSTIITRLARILRRQKPDSIIFICCEYPCKGPHEDDITFMTKSPDGHIVPATSYRIPIGPRPLDVS